MKYDVIKDVTVNGTVHKAGSVIDLFIPADRLIMLGYIVEHVEVEEAPVVENRAVKPKNKRGS